MACTNPYYCPSQYMQINPQSPSMTDQPSGGYMQMNPAQMPQQQMQMPQDQTQLFQGQMQMPMGQMQQPQQQMQTPMMQVPTQYIAQPNYPPSPTGSAPVDFDVMPVMPVFDVGYTQGYLRTQIGRKVKVEFLIGTNIVQDREGTLVDVGISYIIINEVETDDLLLCDIYSIKFVRFYY